MQVVVENAGANKGALILNNEGSLEVAVQYFDGQVNNPEVKTLENCLNLPRSIIYYVDRTQENILINQEIPLTFAADSYFSNYSPQSLLCVPILNQGKLIGILCLENTVTANAFTSERMELLKFLCTQAAISLENARLYQQAQIYAQQLEQSQLQVVQSEKMSALGNLVAGVAHEINNPVGCIVGNVGAVQDSINDLFGVIDLYKEKFPTPGDEIEDELEAVDLEYLREDLPKLIRAMKDGGDRITSISKSLRTFSRADSDQKQLFNIHEGIDSTTLILRHRLKANETRPEIEVITNYGNIPAINCFPGQLNQVFMNILANAIDALDESNQGRSYQDIKANPNRITITTSVSDKLVRIGIADNGKGMNEEIKQKIFDHLFTTKEVGKGTGLGLAIARQIVVETHGGAIAVNSTLGHGTEFSIMLPMKQ